MGPFGSDFCGCECLTQRMSEQLFSPSLSPEKERGSTRKSEHVNFEIRQFVDEEGYSMSESVAKREAGKSSQKGFKKRAEAHLLKCSERVLPGPGHTPPASRALGSCALRLYTDLVVLVLHKSSCIRSPYQLAHNRVE